MLSFYLICHIRTLHPLNQLLRKNTPWVWKIKQRKAFEAAKCLLSQDTALRHYDVKRALKLYCDASSYGLGACLIHAMDEASHILPCPQTTDSSSSGDISSHQDEHDIIMPIVCCEASTDAAELVTLHPHRSCRPPKRLIEEIN